MSFPSHGDRGAGRRGRVDVLISRAVAFAVTQRQRERLMPLDDAFPYGAGRRGVPAGQQRPAQGS